MFNGAFSTYMPYNMVYPSLDKLLGYWAIEILPNNPYPSLVLYMYPICSSDE